MDRKLLITIAAILLLGLSLQQTASLDSPEQYNTPTEPTALRNSDESGFELSSGESTHLANELDGKPSEKRLKETRRRTKSQQTKQSKQRSLRVDSNFDAFVGPRKNSKNSEDGATEIKDRNLGDFESDMTIYTTKFLSPREPILPFVVGGFLYPLVNASNCYCYGFETKFKATLKYFSAFTWLGYEHFLRMKHYSYFNHWVSKLKPKRFSMDDGWVVQIKSHQFIKSTLVNNTHINAYPDDPIKSSNPLIDELQSKYGNVDLPNSESLDEAKKQNILRFLENNIKDEFLYAANRYYMLAEKEDGAPNCGLNKYSITATMSSNGSGSAQYPRGFYMYEDDKIGPALQCLIGESATTPSQINDLSDSQRTPRQSNYFSLMTKKYIDDFQKLQTGDLNFNCKNTLMGMLRHTIFGFKTQTKCNDKAAVPFLVKSGAIIFKLTLEATKKYSTGNYGTQTNATKGENRKEFEVYAVYLITQSGSKPHTSWGLMSGAYFSNRLNTSIIPNTSRRVLKIPIQTNHQTLDDDFLTNSPVILPIAMKSQVNYDSAKPGPEEDDNVCNNVIIGIRYAITAAARLHLSDDRYLKETAKRKLNRGRQQKRDGKQNPSRTSAPNRKLEEFGLDRFELAALLYAKEKSNQSWCWNSQAPAKSSKQKKNLEMGCSDIIQKLNEFARKGPASQTKLVQNLYSLRANCRDPCLERKSLTVDFSMNLPRESIIKSLMTVETTISSIHRKNQKTTNVQDTEGKGAGFTAYNYEDFNFVVEKSQSNDEYAVEEKVCFNIRLVFSNFFKGMFKCISFLTDNYSKGSKDPQKYLSYFDPIVSQAERYHKYLANMIRTQFTLQAVRRNIETLFLIATKEVQSDTTIVKTETEVQKVETELTREQRNESEEEAGEENKGGQDKSPAEQKQEKTMPVKEGKYTVKQLLGLEMFGDEKTDGEGNYPYYTPSVSFTVRSPKTMNIPIEVIIQSVGEASISVRMRVGTAELSFVVLRIFIAATNDKQLLNSILEFNDFPKIADELLKVQDANSRVDLDSPPFKEVAAAIEEHMQNIARLQSDYFESAFKLLIEEWASKTAASLASDKETKVYNKMMLEWESRGYDEEFMDIYSDFGKQATTHFENDAEALKMFQTNLYQFECAAAMLAAVVKYVVEDKDSKLLSVWPLVKPDDISQVLDFATYVGPSAERGMRRRFDPKASEDWLFNDGDSGNSGFEGIQGLLGRLREVRASRGLTHAMFTYGIRKYLLPSEKDATDTPQGSPDKTRPDVPDLNRKLRISLYEMRVGPLVLVLASYTTQFFMWEYLHDFENYPMLWMLMNEALSEVLSQYRDLAQIDNKSEKTIFMEFQTVAEKVFTDLSTESQASICTQSTSLDERKISIDYYLNILNEKSEQTPSENECSESDLKSLNLLRVASLSIQDTRVNLEHQRFVLKFFGKRKPKDDSHPLDRPESLTAGSYNSATLHSYSFAASNFDGYEQQITSYVKKAYSKMIVKLLSTKETKD
jgi:hypothetical protein